MATLALHPLAHPGTRRPHKAPGVDIKRSYRLTVEVGLVLALAVLIALVRAPLRTAATLDVAVAEQEVVAMEEIQATRQELPPPPPPRPRVLAVVSDDVVLDDVVLDLDAALDLDAPIAELPPPPPPPAPADEPEPEEEEPEVFIAVETPPELIGGIEGLHAAISYPEVARLAGIEGRVVVQFIVDEEGRVLNPVVLKSIGAGCDEEALRVISQARFTPGRQRGKAVRVKFAIPVTFRLHTKSL